ncbi:hypothetical protein MARBORIA2_04710 [Methanobrevibacter arboriphilus]|jgi:hypothetical protein|uniref:Uncharacterized protein n=1 Tax=Methanobrevibacter arboriphilus TaxID=39441 RepID=A0ACA8R135_METAZ|nr:hypothetical protein MarbSA_03260 [Methanobrevibacter arboriphilus]GLI11381.1 hypothetical protein MARBORIA2_04710 [Methanobrevibacter arboriphilus]
MKTYLTELIKILKRLKIKGLVLINKNSTKNKDKIQYLIKYEYLIIQIFSKTSI